MPINHNWGYFWVDSNNKERKQMRKGEFILSEAYDVSEGKEDEDQEVVRRPH